VNCHSRSRLLVPGESGFAELQLIDYLSLRAAVPQTARDLGAAKQSGFNQNEIASSAHGRLALTIN
jgi:hypothetical protein